MNSKNFTTPQLQKITNTSIGTPHGEHGCKVITVRGQESANLATQNPRGSSIAKEPTPLLKPQYNFHSRESVSELFNSGEVRRNELLHDLTVASDYYQRPIIEEHASEIYRKLTATHHLKDSALSEKAYVFKIFGQDCVDEQLTAAQLDWAVAKWRKGDNSFAPTFGQLLTMIRDGGYSTPTAADYKSYKIRIQSVIDPNFVEPAKTKFKGIRTEPEPLVEDLSAEDRKAIVERVNARIGKLGDELKPKTHGQGDKAKQRRKDLFLASRQHTLEVGPRETPEGGPTFYAIIGREKDGKTITHIRTELNEVAANEFVKEARAI